MRKIGWLIAWAFVALALMNGLSHAGSGATPEMQACKQKLFDHYVIADALLNGATRESLIAAANEKLEGARRDKALELIEEASRAEDVAAWFHGYWFPCLEELGQKTGFHRVDSAARSIEVKSQAWYCDLGGELAESMDRSFAVTEFQPRHFPNAFERAVAQHVVACRAGGMRPGETIRNCVVRLCMGSPT